MPAMKLIQSVGIGGANKPDDVKAVQTALNSLLSLIPPTKKLVVDKRLGSRPENSKTVAAIKLFQSKVVNMVRPDGKIDPNGRTHRKINEKLANAAVVTVVPISGTLKATLKRNLEQYENRIPHMYKDTTGNITAGVGHLIKDIEAAKKIAFVVRNTGVLATKKEIEDEFIKFKGLSLDKNTVATAFKKYSTLELGESLMDKQVENHINNFEKELKQVYGTQEFQSYSDNVKLALFDMIFNLGMTKLISRFPKFNRHIKANDFEKAALECSRTDVSAQRNTYVKNLLGK